VTPSTPVRWLKAFARFWWDFLVGDTPELFVAVVVTIGLVAVLSLAGHFTVAAAIVLPALVVAALVLSVWRASRAR
jgi:hypothetical protein